MLKDKSSIKGFVRVTVFGPDGKIKRFPKTWWQKLFGLQGRLMQVENHNIVTDEGDAMVADIMSETPTQTKVDGTNGHIEVGTGFTTESKGTLSCVTPTGSPELLDAPYPQQKGAFGAANDNTTQYRATFEAGDLDAIGIDEAALINNVAAASADCLAYAQISPAVDVSVTDTLQVDWEITYLGS